MKLNYVERTAQKKSNSKMLRNTGFFPAVIYAKGHNPKHVAINAGEFSALVRSVIPGRLATTSIELIDDKGAATKALLKDIQYHPTTYNVLHVDFEILCEGSEINVKVPIEYVGAAECSGVKLGGVLRPVIRSLRVRCLPKDIPNSFPLDVKNLNMRESRRLSDLSISAGIRPLADLKQVAVVIAKR